MIYSDQNITEEQARSIIGNKMCKRIDALNKWLSDNDFTLLVHSTSVDNVDSIFNKGLQFVSDYSFDSSREDIIGNCSVTEQELCILGEEAKKMKVFKYV